MKDKFNMVGSEIKEFSLQNSLEQTINVKEYRNKKNVVVILLRDIKWPFCRAHVGSLAADYEKFEAENAVLYPILVDTPKHAEDMSRIYAKRKYPIYSDPEDSVAKILLNQEFKILKLGRMPALLVVDKNGIIRYAHYGDNMHDIPPNEEILQVLKNINTMK
jgi:peroxiredoxin